MKAQIELKSLTLKELKKEKLILGIKTTIINILISTPFSKRLKKVREIETILNQQTKCPKKKRKKHLSKYS